MTYPATYNSAAQIAAALRDSLPADQRESLAGEIALAADVIAGLPIGQRGPADVAQALEFAGLSQLRTVLQIDARKDIDFSGAQVGDVKIGDVAQGNIIKPTIMIHQAQPPRLSHDELQEQRNRTALLGLVRRFWVEGVLGHSLHQRVLIELGMQSRPDTIDQPWQQIVRLPDQAPYTLTACTSFLSVFEQASHQLLILGAPGGGKTTMLLTLAEQLLAAAQDDPALPIPVVFQLSTWAVRRPTLADWLVTELKERYKVPPKLGQMWVEAGAILPLLDGLDEVGPSDAERAACVGAINTYLKYSGAQAIVCSRSAEYAKLGAKLALDTAIEILPLEPGQVDTYLAQLGPPLAGLRAAVTTDATFCELARSPLLLSVMALTYRNQPATALAGQTLVHADRQLWCDYVRNRLALKRADAPTDTQQLRAWLIWLARGMQAHGQQVFYIEYLQPSWLATRGQHRLFHLVISLIVGLVSGMIVGLVSGMIVGLVSGMIVGRNGIELTETLSWNWRHALSWQCIRRNLVVSMIFGLVVSMIVNLVSGMIVGMVFGLVYFPLMDMLKGAEIQISTQPNEGIRRSQRSMIIGGLVVGLVVGLVFGLFVNLITDLVVGLVLGVLSYGGSAVIKHYILRLLLLNRCGAPWDFASALDEAVSRNLMTRVGGGYRFYHRLLQDHFAQDDLPVAAILGPQSDKERGGRRARD
jgi:hypothetical protein